MVHANTVWRVKGGLAGWLRYCRSLELLTWQQLISITTMSEQSCRALHFLGAQAESILDAQQRVFQARRNMLNTMARCKAM